jgi:hypothetical protein
MSIAGGQKSIRLWQARISLDREERLRHGIIEAPI